MSAPKRVSDQRVLDALVRREGNMQAVAEDLGIARKNAYDRLSSLGVNPDDYRPADRKVGAFVVKRGNVTVRLRPEQEEELRQAKFDLQAKLRQDLTERSILQGFFEDAFAEWLKGKLT